MPRFFIKNNLPITDLYLALRIRERTGRKLGASLRNMASGYSTVTSFSDHHGLSRKEVGRLFGLKRMRPYDRLDEAPLVRRMHYARISPAFRNAIIQRTRQLRPEMVDTMGRCIHWDHIFMYYFTPEEQQEFMERYPLEPPYGQHSGYLRVYNAFQVYRSIERKVFVESILARPWPHSLGMSKPLIFVHR